MKITIPAGLSPEALAGIVRNVQAEAAKANVPEDVLVVTVWGNAASADMEPLAVDVGLVDDAPEKFKADWRAHCGLLGSHYEVRGP